MTYTALWMNQHVMLTNNPDLFKKCGVYNPEISDHSMIYSEMTEKLKKYNQDSSPPTN